MEACVDSVMSALNAFEGGASRLELCSALSEGGLTPSVGLLKVIKSRVDIPVFVMIRPRTGDDFVYTEDELLIMEHDAELLKNNGADGFVFGALTPDHRVDVEACSRILNVIAGRPATFHRAFDMVLNPDQALEALIDLGFHRLLTSGLQASAHCGASSIAQLVTKARNRISVMPGCGLTPDNLAEVLRTTRASEFHATAKEGFTLALNRKSKAASCGTLFVTDKDTVEKMVLIFKEYFYMSEEDR